MGGPIDYLDSEAAGILILPQTPDVFVKELSHAYCLWQEMLTLDFVWAKPDAAASKNCTIGASKWESYSKFMITF